MENKKYNSVLLKNFYTNVEMAFKDKHKVQEVILYISKFIDRNNIPLTYIAPTKRLLFSRDGSDGNIIYNFLQIEPDDVKQVVKGIPSIKSISDVIKQPLFVMLTLIIRYCTENKIKDDITGIFRFYLILAMYSSLQARQFKFEPNENIVSYTVNRLGSKFYFKKYGTVQETLAVVGNVLHDKDKTKLLKDNDKMIVEYTMDLRTRLSNLLVVFSRELYKDQKEGNFLNTTADSSDEENYYERTSSSAGIEGLVDKTAISFFQNRIENKYINMSSKMNKIPSSSLRSTLIDIQDNERESIYTILRDIISVYIQSGNSIESVSSRKFVNESLSIYGQSNTKLDQVKEIKSIMDKYLEDYANKYNKSDRAATRLAYRRSIYLYFVFLITYTA